MARIILTRALAQQTDGMLEHQVMRGDVRSALEQLIDRYPHLRQVLLNDRSHLREHINVFVNDELVGERVRLVDAVGDGDTVFVLQSVSGGATRSVEMVAKYVPAQPAPLRSNYSFCYAPSALRREPAEGANRMYQGVNL